MDNNVSPGVKLSLSINISAGLLIDLNLIAQILSLIDRAHVPPCYIIFEITEDMEIINYGAALRSLLKLRLSGYGVSLDDYGIGFSSTNRLSRIPFTEVKLDRSLVHNAYNRAHLRTILASTILLATSLGMKVVAEGVESAEDLEVLKVLGCHFAQGYHLAKPMPMCELAHFTPE